MLDMVRVGYAQNNAFRQRPQMYAARNVELSYREQEIVERLRGKLAEIGSELLFDLGRTFEGEDGVMFVSGFFGNMSEKNSPFILSRQTLAEMAADDAKYHEWLAKIDSIISQERQNRQQSADQSDLISAHETAKRADRLFQLSRANNMGNILDLLDLSDRSDSPSRSQQERMVGGYESMLADFVER
ncbi:MAG: hypothetical protein FWG65_02170 [Turicibacter sp.]|nr:hypothetical protein [Turicibacter sp.]